MGPAEGGVAGAVAEKRTESGVELRKRQRLACKCNRRNVVIRNRLPIPEETENKRHPPTDRKPPLPITHGELTVGRPNRCQLACFILLQQN